MIDKSLLETLNTNDKEKIISTLDRLIKQTFAVENEYKALRDSYDSLHSIIEQIIESLPHAIWVLKKSGEIFLQNSKAKKIVRIMAEIDRKKCEDEIEFGDRTYLININKTDDKIIITATDITEQKRSQRLASMGQVAAHLAHEIRNPIGSISILASTLLKRVDPKEKPLVFEIKKAIYRVERIIKSTLLFTKGVQIEKEDIDLLHLGDEIVEAFESYEFSKAIDLQIDFDDKMIYGDLDTLLIVMQNFLYNAIDAIEESDDESGEIRFSHQSDKEYDMLIVEDSGVAIKDTKILYEPFQTTKTKGHGLGLALSKEIITAHGGKIELLKEKKGFIIYIKRGES